MTGKQGLDVSPDVAALLEGTTPGDWIADDFCEERDQRTRVGTSDGSPTYYHRTATIAYCQTNHDEDDNPVEGEPIVGIVEAERNARLIAAAPSIARAYLALSDERNDLKHWKECAEEGLAERDTAISALSERVAGMERAVRGAIAGIESADLYSQMCCSGHECGCRGSTNADLLAHDLRATLAPKEQSK